MGKPCGRLAKLSTLLNVCTSLSATPCRANLGTIVFLGFAVSEIPTVTPPSTCLGRNRGHDLLRFRCLYFSSRFAISEPDTVATLTHARAELTFGFLDKKLYLFWIYYPISRSQKRSPHLRAWGHATHYGGVAGPAWRGDFSAAPLGETAERATLRQRGDKTGDVTSRSGHNTRSRWCVGVCVVGMLVPAT